MTLAPEPTTPPLERAAVEAVYPTTPLQKALHLQARDASTDVGLVQVCFRVDGDLDAELVADCWKLVFERHQGLRASIQEAKKQARSVVVVHRVAEPRIETFDLRDTPEASQGGTIAEHLARDRAAGLRLDAPPVARIAWFRCSEDRHAFVWTCHHALIDGWSSWIVLAEWRQAYVRRARGEAPKLSDPVPLRGYREYLARRDAEGEARFWTERLRGGTWTPFPSPEPNLPAEAKTLERVLDLSAAHALEAAARGLKVTPGALASAAWAMVLHRFLDASEVIFGSVVSGRPADLPGAAAMVGMFSNTLPTRCAVAAHDRASDLVRRVHAEQQATLAHQATSLEDLYRYAEHRGPGRLFETLLVFQNLPRGAVEHDGAIRLSEFRSGVSSAYPLTLSVEPGDDGWRLALTADRPRVGLDPAAWLDAYLEALKRIVEAPEERIEALLPTAPTRPRRLRAPARSVVAPTKDIEKILLAIWQRELDAQPALGITDDFFERGGHSMLALRIFNEIERQLGCRLPLVTLATHPTVAKLAEVVETQLASSPTEVVTIALSTRGERPPLVLMPAMGGEALFWHHLEDWGRERPIFTLGLTTPKLPWTAESSLGEIADCFVPAIRSTFDPAVPVNLAGYSFGGQLAFAVGERLRAASSQVGTIVIVDTVLDNPPGPIEPLPERLRPFLRNIGRWVREEAETFDRARWTARAGRAGQAVLRRLRPAPSVDNPLEGIYEADALPDDHLERIQADRDAAARYRPESPHPGHLVVMRAKRQPLLRPRAWDLNWGQVVSGSVEVVEVPGNHENVVFPPYGRILARELRSALNRAEDR